MLTHKEFREAFACKTVRDIWFMRDFVSNQRRRIANGEAKNPVLVRAAIRWGEKLLSEAPAHLRKY